jgi:hypothetical protein
VLVARAPLVHRRLELLQLGVQLNGLVIELGRLRAQELGLGLQLEHELAAFASRQIAEGRGLPRERRHQRAHIRGELRRDDEAVALEVALPFEACSSVHVKIECPFGPLSATASSAPPAVSTCLAMRSVTSCKYRRPPPRVSARPL